MIRGPDDLPLSEFSFNRPIPKAVRDFGSALDPNILEAGDLLLFARKVPNWSSARIVDAQSNQFSASHACWYHAAVSAGKFEICEATRSGVEAREYWQYMTGEYDIKIRRLKNASAAERSMVAYYAATNVRKSYGFFNLVELARTLADGDPWARRSLIYKGVICSQLYFEACMRIGVLLNTIPSTKICPAHLSVSTQMIDVAPAWVKV